MSTIVSLHSFRGGMGKSNTWLMQQQEAELPEVATFVEQDEAITHTQIAELVARGFVQEIRSQGEGQPRYRVRLAARRGRSLLADL